MPKPLIILVGADKGGVGKTTVARALGDWLDRIHVPAREFDTEHPSGDLVRFRPGAVVIDAMAMRDQMQVFDGVDAERVTVLDIRAGLLSGVLRALDAARLLADVRAGAVNLAVLHVIGPSVASLNEIAEAAKTIGGGAKHYLVKNHVNDTAFDLADDPRYAAAFAQARSVTVEVPKLSEVACEEIQRLGVGFADFAAGSSSRTLRGYVATWLDQVCAEFERVGLRDLIGEQ